MLERLDFLYVSAEAPEPPAWSEFAPYERVVWCGVSFRRFTRIWTPERSHFFSGAFQGRALATKGRVRMCNQAYPSYRRRTS